MPTFANGESAASVRTKINDAIDKVDGAAPITSVNIDSGTIDGATIGGSSAAAGTFTTLTATGDVDIADKIVHSGDTNTAIRFPAADTVTVETSGTERMRIDSSGNVGIGVTPSAWASSTALQIGATSAFWNISGNGTQVSNNYAFTGGGNLYIANGYATTYVQNSSGQHAWYTAPSGTAGNAITFTQAMTLDASGNLGIGTTSPSQKLSVSGSVSGSNYYLDVAAGTYGIASDTSIEMYGSASSQVMLFKVNGNTERARIDSSGNLLVGTTSANLSAAGRGNINVNGSSDALLMLSKGASSTTAAYFYFDGTDAEVRNINNGALKLSTNNTEHLRIDSSGNLLVGTTTQQGRVTIVGAAASSKPLAFDTNASYAEIQSYDSGPLYINRQGNDVIVNSGGGNLLVGTTASDPISSQVNGISLGSDQIIRVSKGDTVCAAFARRGTDGAVINFNKNTTQVGTITVTGSATAYNTSSDYRLKENVAPMQNALDTVAQLNPVTYTWKADGSAGQGFIAHELQAVVPDCVTGEKDAVDAEGNPQYQGVDTSFLVATLCKAIQEQQAIITALEARITALEG